MIKLRIAALCKERLIAHPWTALVEAGISEKKTNQYLNGKTNRLMLDDIEKLCTLLRCTPNDLFEWTPANKSQDYPENPLQAIAKKPLFNLEDVLNGLTIAEVKARLGKDGENGK